MADQNSAPVKMEEGTLAQEGSDNLMHGMLPSNSVVGMFAAPQGDVSER